MKVLSPSTAADAIARQSAEAKRLREALHGKPVRMPRKPMDRKTIAAAQIEALERGIVRIKRKLRENHAWQHGYNSAITAIEAEIQEIRNAG